MSKKKVASRSAMTLKDFHGGSIPSDLPLPSAPGMTVDRSVFERQGSGTWMSPTLGRGYSNDRSVYHRQGPSSGVRTFEDKASYFPNPANIGRNYDEDERKPVDSRPRSSHSADRFDDHAFEERRGGYSTDRYTLEDQGNFGSAPSYSETRSLGTSDRFPPSQVTGGGFESDIYVHDEFGLIPVGPPPSRVPPQEHQTRSHPSSYQREVVETRPDQLAYVMQQTPSAPSYSPNPQTATSPPRSWRNPSHQAQSTSGATQLPSESATNVWTVRRDGEVSRMPTSDLLPSDNSGSSAWRQQSAGGRMLETRAVDKVSSGRWQGDLSRPSGTGERRQQLPAPLPDQGREAIHYKPFGADYSPDSARSLHASDTNQPRYADARGLAKSDSGHGMQSAGAVKGISDEGSRMGVSTSVKAIRSHSGRGGGLGIGDFPDRVGSTEEQTGGYVAYGIDTVRQRYGEESSGSFSDAERFIGTSADSERVAHSGTPRGGVSDSGRLSGDTGRGGYVDSRGGLTVDDESPDVSDQSKAGFKDANRVGFTSGGVGGLSSNGRFSSFESARSVYLDCTRHAEGGEGSLSADGGLLAFTENGRTAPGIETGRNPRLTASGEQAEIMERPKLKLLPRSKPLEKIETSNVESENVVGYEESSRKSYSPSDDKQQPDVLSLEAAVPKRLNVHEVGTTNDENDEDGSRKVERPKLNLKPRSQPAEAELGEGSQKVRQLVFGGARPRELVLKERGVDDILTGSQDGVQTPMTPSLKSSASSGSKMEQGHVVKVERSDTRTEDKQDSCRYERQERSFERQGSHRGDRQEGSRVDRGLDNRWDLEKDSQWDQERPDGLRRRELDRQDNKRENDSRRDIDKQESWRRPIESSGTVIGVKNSSPAVSSLVDPSPRASGRYGYSPAASAVELAQAFSRSSSVGSTMSGTSWAANSLRTPLSPIPKSSVQGFAPGYGNGIVSSHANRDTPFSRLAEASPPPFSANNTEMYLPGGSFGLDSQYFGSGKLGGYGDTKTGPSFGRPDIGTGRDLNEENGDLPGKRGLPVRQKDGYFD